MGKKFVKIVFLVLTVFEFLLADMVCLSVTVKYGSYSKQILTVAIVFITLGGVLSILFALRKHWLPAAIFSAIMASAYILLGVGLSNAGSLAFKVFIAKNFHVAIPFVIAAVLAVCEIMSRRRADKAEYLRLKKQREKEKSEENEVETEKGTFD